MYTPDPVPENAPTGLKAWLAEQLRRIANELNATPSLSALPAPPARPKDGTIVGADGTNWNPGGGAGVYLYTGGAWVKL